MAPEMGGPTTTPIERKAIEMPRRRPRSWIPPIPTTGTGRRETKPPWATLHWSVVSIPRCLIRKWSSPIDDRNNDVSGFRVEERPNEGHDAAHCGEWYDHGHRTWEYVVKSMSTRPSRNTHRTYRRDIPQRLVRTHLQR